MSTLEILSNLIQRLDSPELSDLSVIPWATPVISFGNLSSSRIATLGLNPSNREFVDSSGVELTGNYRRFHTLGSLNIEGWSEVREEHIEKIKSSCDEYFDKNPYDRWFKSLEKLIAGSGISYYGLFSNACHLDIVPYVTSTKWGELSIVQRHSLLKMTADSLGLLLRESNIEILILNGQSVIENLQSASRCSFKREIIQDWVLPRRSTKGVTGYAYTGTISQVSGVELGRKVHVLGYNHNIQSSFGVTKKVKDAIQEWISRSTKEVFC